MSELLFEGSEWSFPLIEKTLEEVERIGVSELGVRIRPNQVELVSSNQMLEAYTSHGMPVSYHHWSNGKSFLQQKQSYDRGEMGLAYEIVINSDPVIALCMEGNSMAMQALVLAHASVGHNSFFEMNYLFRNWTDPSGIVDYLLFAKRYVSQCEEKYGIDAVEDTLDAAHALRYVSFDRSKRPPKLSKEKERQRELRLLDAKEKERTAFDFLLETKSVAVVQDDELEYEENVLYYLEKHSPILKPWQKELLRIVRKCQQYFYPQIQTQVMNEGWASTVHYYILNRLYELGKITEGALLETMHSHTSVLTQRAGPNFNPYALGFAIYKDIRRICEKPTKEDEQWFPNLVGRDFKSEWLFAVENFRDESFILQYLSPQVMRDFRMFTLTDDADVKHYEVTSIHNEEGYTKVRNQLSESYRLENRLPNIVVTGADMTGSRTLFLEHHTQKGVLLKDPKPVMKYIKALWGYHVVLYTIDEDGDTLQTLEA
jgi:stage V sporulation protein R